LLVTGGNVDEDDHDGDDDDDDVDDDDDDVGVMSLCYIDCAFFSSYSLSLHFVDNERLTVFRGALSVAYGANPFTTMAGWIDAITQMIALLWSGSGVYEYRCTVREWCGDNDNVYKNYESSGEWTRRGKMNSDCIDCKQTQKAHDKMGRKRARDWMRVPEHDKMGTSITLAPSPVTISKGRENNEYRNMKWSTKVSGLPR